MAEITPTCDYCGDELPEEPYVEDLWPKGKYCNVECHSAKVEDLEHQEYMDYHHPDKA